MGTHRDWNFTTPTIKNQYHCLLIDLPGVKTPLSISSFEELSFNLKELIQTLTESKSLLIGYSLGGRIALDFATRYPELISGMILESCHPGLESQKDREQRLKSDQSLFSNVSHESKDDFLKFLRKWYSLPLFGSISNHKMFPQLLQKRMENDLKKLKSVIHSFSLGNQNNFYPKLDKITFPTLYISGGKR